MLFQCLESRSQAETTEKNSRFIALAWPVVCDEEVKKHWDHIKKLHRKANHVAYAYRLAQGGPSPYRCHDDGEVAGTAGRPILQRLESAALVYTVIYVVRYFGGTKLGKGGLIRAYGSAAQKVIDEAKLIAFEELLRINITIAFAREAFFRGDLARRGGKVCNSHYGDQVTFIIELPKKEYEGFKLVWG